MTALFVQRLAFDRAAAQQPPLALGKVGAGMDGAAVVPHQKVAELPDMLEDELAPLAEGVELFQDRVALGGLGALDPRGHQPVDEQAAAAGLRMGDEDRMVVMWNAADVA